MPTAAARPSSTSTTRSASAVDPSKEHEIRDAMATVMRGRTTIVIAHRPGTIALADRVVLVDEGRAAAVGTHEELLAGNERYRAVLAAWSEEDMENARADADAGAGTEVDVIERDVTGDAASSEEPSMSGGD